MRERVCVGAGGGGGGGLLLDHTRELVIRGKVILQCFSDLIKE